MGLLDEDFINLDFWLSWPKRFYNIKAYDRTNKELQCPEPEEVDKEKKKVRYLKNTILLYKWNIYYYIYIKLIL